MLSETLINTNKPIYLWSFKSSEVMKTKSCLLYIILKFIIASIIGPLFIFMNKNVLRKCTCFILSKYNA